MAGNDRADASWPGLLLWRTMHIHLFCLITQFFSKHKLAEERLLTALPFITIAVFAVGFFLLLTAIPVARRG